MVSSRRAPEATTFTGPKEASILQGLQHVMHVDPYLTLRTKWNQDQPLESSRPRITVGF